MVEHDAHIPLAAISGDCADRGDIPPDSLVIKATRLRILWEVTHIVKPPLVVNAVGLIRLDARYQMVNLQLGRPVDDGLPCQDGIVAEVAQFTPGAVTWFE